MNFVFRVRLLGEAKSVTRMAQYVTQWDTTCRLCHGTVTGWDKAETHSASTRLLRILSFAAWSFCLRTAP